MESKERAIKILLVEDNPEDVELTEEALAENKINHELYVVGDGEECLKFLYKKKDYKNVPTPDIVLLDLNMPKKDGREVLAEIKNNKALKHIPVIVLTTSRAEKDIIESYRHHANCYITKPIDFNSFETLVKEIERFWFSIATIPISYEK